MQSETYMPEVGRLSAICGMYISISPMLLTAWLSLAIPCSTGRTNSLHTFSQRQEQQR